MPPRAGAGRPSAPASLVVGLFCAVVALAWLWPLPPRMHSALAPDLGDPLLNTWILAWDFWQATGGPGSYWDANIFHPLDGTLAFSETLAPLAVLGLPVWLVTRNPVLAYNLVLVLSFALGGGAVFGLARRYLEEPPAPGRRLGSETGERYRAEAPGRARHAGGEASGAEAGHSAAILGAAGLGALLFVFSPYRQQHLPHVQVLWASWLPLTLLAAERYLDRPSVGWMAAGVGAATALALTNTYFAVFGGLVLLVHLVARGGRRFIAAVRVGSIPRRHAGWALVLLLTAAGLLAGFGLGYARAQRVHGIERGIEEVRSRSARPAHLLEASPRLALWGSRLGDVRQDVELRLFPGALTALLGLLGAGMVVRRAVRGVDAPPSPAWQRWGARAARLVALLASLALGWLLVGNVVDTRLLGTRVTMTTEGRPALILALALIAWGALSPRLRTRLRRLFDLLTGPWGWLLASIPLLWVVATGPGSGADAWWLTRLLPMASGLRVPARAFTLIALGLALLAARGAWELLRRLPTPAVVALTALLGVLGLAESWAAPLPLNRPIWIYPALDADRLLTAEPSDLTRRLAALPRGTPVAVLPLGEDQIDLVHMYRSTRHWQPLVNGFSGFIPPRYRELERTLRSFPEADALRALAADGVGWVVVHPELWPRNDRGRLRRALATSEAVEVVGSWESGLLVRILDPPVADAGADS